MIEYLEIINIIKDVKEDAMEEFNKKVSVPMAIANLNSSVIKQENKNIVIENRNQKIEILYETRIAYYEILAILKKINKDLYQKIDFKYIDFFGKFKSNDCELDIENQKIEEVNFSFFTLQILTILNIKFWCNNDDERKEFLENMKNKPIIKDYEKNEEKIILEKEENDVENKELNIAKNNWWINLLNRLRKFKK